LRSDDPVLRYWGATGFLLLGKEAEIDQKLIVKASQDSVVDVAAVAAETLYGLGMKEAGREALLKGLKSPNEFSRTRVMNVIDAVNENSKEIKDAVGSIKDGTTRQGYDIRMVDNLQKKWAGSVE